MGSTFDTTKAEQPAREPSQPNQMPSTRQEPSSPPRRLAYSVQDAAAILGLSTDTIYELVRGNRLPHRRIGRRILIPCRVLEDWVSAQEPWASFDAT